MHVIGVASGRSAHRSLGTASGRGNDAPVGGSFFANAPGGWTLIDDQPFTSIPVHAVNSPDADGWSDPDAATAHFSEATDAAAPFPSHPCLTVTYPTGMAGGVAPGRMVRDLSAGEQFKNIYFSTIVQLSSNFTMNGNAGSKYLWPGADQVEGTMLYTTFDGATDLDFGLAQQGGPDRLMTFNVGSVSNARFGGFLGQYKEIEILLRANTANGTADGEFHCWIAGIKTHQYRPADGNGVDFAMTASRKFLSLDMNPTYGGGSATVPVAGMFMRWNRLKLTGSNV